MQWSILPVIGGAIGGAVMPIVTYYRRRRDRRRFFEAMKAGPKPSRNMTRIFGDDPEWKSRFTQSDGDAIASDVAVVGDDMRAAIEKFKAEHPEITDWPEDDDDEAI